MKVFNKLSLKGKKAASSVLPISLITQLSIDRIDRLFAICSAWGVRGAVVAAVLDEDRSGDMAINASQILLSDFQRAVANSDHCGIITLLLIRRPLDAQSSYPINHLRNFALQSANSEFVFLVDVDCIPSADTLHNLCGTSDSLAELRGACVGEMRAIFVPCFETNGELIETQSSFFELFPPPTMTATGGAAVFFTADDVRHLTGADASSRELPLRPFMSAGFFRGHRATRFDRWLRLRCAGEARTVVPSYPIDYEEGFEPYVVCARLYAPKYCEALSGYGRNKTLHIYHMHRLGVGFVVHPDCCAVHIPHRCSGDRVRLLGHEAQEKEQRGTRSMESNKEERETRDEASNAGKVQGLLEGIKSIYGEHRQRISHLCSSWAVEVDDGFWSSEHASRLRVAVSWKQGLALKRRRSRYARYPTARGSACAWIQREYTDMLRYSGITLASMSAGAIESSEFDSEIRGDSSSSIRADPSTPSSSRERPRLPRGSWSKRVLANAFMLHGHYTPPRLVLRRCAAVASIGPIGTLE